MARILIVDDDASTLQMVGEALEVSGFEVARAVDGFFAMQALGLKPPESVEKQGDPDWKLRRSDWTADSGEPALPDLMITDCMMPRVDGLTLVTAMAYDERVSKLPVIVLTSKPKMEEPFRQVPNVAGFLCKPFRPVELIAMVRKALPAPA